MKTLVGSIACLGLFAGALMRDPQVERSDAKRRLSQMLPEELAAFVVKTGADRDVSDQEAADVAALKAGEADVEVLAKVLHPAEVVEFGFALTVVGAVEAKKAGGQRKPEEPRIIAASTVALADGTELPVGERLFAGDVIVRGVVLNAGDTEVILFSEAGDEVVIGPAALALAKCLKTCTVTCGDGFFACCSRNNSGTCVSCSCFPDGSQTSCQSGGPGATSCSAGVTE